MSINKTIEAIRCLGDGDEVGNYEWRKDKQEWQLIDILEVDGLKSLADAYEALQSEIAELREALEHYADDLNWGYLGDSYTVYRHGRINETSGPDIAQAVLDKHKQEGK